MFRTTISILFPALLLGFSHAQAAGDDSLLEPCINGSVSASGYFPSQAMEDQFNAYLQWQDDELYYYHMTQIRRDRAAAADSPDE